MRTIGIILKKELKRFFTDFRMLMGIILPGVVIFLVYSLMGGVMENSFKPDSNFTIYIENEPAEIKAIRDMITESSEEGYSFTIETEELSKDSKLKRIKDKELSAYIIYPEGFIDSVISYIPNPNTPAPMVEIYYNSANETSALCYQIYRSCLEAFEEGISNRLDINRGEGFDMATKEDTSMMVISMILPMLLMIMLFSSTMALCSESIAGEKERGTFATMLITPAKRYQIAVGKILALALASLASSVISFIGLIASLPKLMGNGVSIEMYGAETFIMILLVIIVTVLLFTTILTMLSAYSKSVKEASTLASPIMMLVVVISVMAMLLRNYEPAWYMYLIPIFNSITCFQGLLNMNLSMLNIGITIISNIVFIALGVFFLAKMFNSERVMFNK